MSEPIKPTGPELTQGIEASEVPEGGVLVGQAAGEPVLLVRQGSEVFAIAAGCGHYGAPLADGIIVGDQLRCPWHHAAFDVRTGEAVCAPSVRHIDTWEVTTEGTRVRVGAKRPQFAGRSGATGPSSVVIIGAGAAGDAAAERLRREGYTGPITMVSKHGEGPPLDRPNLSKDYLAGTAPEDWIPLRGAAFYVEKKIDHLDGVSVTGIDPKSRTVTLSNGKALSYGALLLATGAKATRLDLPGSGLPHVFTLRTLNDSRGIIAALGKAKTAVVLGSSFIGLEAAASLRARNVEVTVAGPGARPLEKILGSEVGDFVKALHEEHGVKFHLGRKPTEITATAVHFDDGSSLKADLVVMGVGVQPELELAKLAGLTIERGVIVDEFLRTSDASIYAAGDIARFPAGAETWRIEHWVVAQQQGHTAALNMLGKQRAYRDVPFFWSQHYDVPVNYVGHAESFDRVQVAGDLSKRDALVAYWKSGKIVAVATVYRDRDCLLAEDALARGDQAALERLLR